MNLLSASITLVLLVSGGLVVLIYRRNRLPLPPAIPSLRKGNGYPWEYYRDFSRKLGPLISVSSYGASVVVLNTIEAAVELLDRRKIYACRPHWPMVELLGRQDNIGFTYYGERLKRMRKLLRSVVFTDISRKWGTLMDDESTVLCYKLLESPHSFHEWVERVPQHLVFNIAYGQGPDSEYMRLVSKTKADTASALQPGRWAINHFPILRFIPSWMPGAQFQRWAEVARADFISMMKKPFDEVKIKHQRGEASFSLVRECIENHLGQNIPADESIIMSTAASLFTAGTETITATISVFVGLMLRHEDVQTRAYEEIVRVVGSSQLPSLEHRASLPFINAIIQEVQRFHPVVPLIAHGNTCKDVYNGWRIPNKTWVIANVWAILHDETIYSDPDKFEPARFLSENDETLPDPANVVFGFGRRRCPGAEFANLFLYLVISRILALYKVSPTNSQDPPTLKFELGLVTAPTKFLCDFVPRANAAEILRNHKPYKV